MLNIDLLVKEKIKEIDEMWNKLPRAERRRFERELNNLKPNPGVGQGWRLTASSYYLHIKYGVPIEKLKKAPVNELTKSTDTYKLEYDSIKKQIELGIVVLDS